MHSNLLLSFGNSLASPSFQYVGRLLTPIPAQAGALQVGRHKCIIPFMKQAHCSKLITTCGNHDFLPVIGNAWPKVFHEPNSPVVDGAEEHCLACMHRA